MSANDLLTTANQGLYVLIFLVTLVHAVRYPRRANVDMALLFGDAPFTVALGALSRSFPSPVATIASVLTLSFTMAIPYLLLRLVDDFTDVPPAVMRIAEIILAAFVVCFVAIPGPLPAALILALVLYFVGIEGFAAVAIVREARRSVGPTRRRMQAIATGSLFLALAVIAAGLQLLGGGSLAAGLGLLTALCALASGVAYFLGFATPPFLRRAWQMADLRSFLATVPTLAYLPDLRAVTAAYQDGAARAVGAPNARVGLWDEAAGVLHFPRGQGDGYFDVAPGDYLAGQVFVDQRPLFTDDATRTDPANADLYRSLGSTSLLMAPITSKRRRLGVLVVYAQRTPIFAEDDLEVVELLANQAAAVLENRRLIDELASSRAREQATRLKDDFLSAAAHDLQTPLTTLIAQAQLLERGATRNPDVPPDLAGIQRILREAQRLNQLVRELLDVTRVERGQFLLNPQTVDLVSLAREACERYTSAHHACVVEAAGPVVGSFDETRMSQVIDHLVENAVKFSPDGGEIRVHLATEGDQAVMSVADKGIGIPSDDVPYVFDRFRRGANVNDRQFAGMGLGLYLVRAIVEQHGGHVSATSSPTRGTVVRLYLPLSQPAHNGSQHLSDRAGDGNGRDAPAVPLL
jgi:signal transduction histidine kinase